MEQPFVDPEEDFLNQFLRFPEGTASFRKVFFQIRPEKIVQTSGAVAVASLWCSVQYSRR
jgi:hypothetical protein